MARGGYPMVKFKLTPSLNVQKIVLTGPAIVRWGMSSQTRIGWGQDEKGKQHYLRGLFDTHADAVKSGSLKLEEQEARLKKSQANIKKRRENLEKAKGAAA